MINLGSNVMGIGLSIVLRDRFTAQANRVAASMGIMNKQARTLQASLGATQIMGFGLAAGGLLMARSFKKAVDISSDFHYTLKGVQAVSQATTEELNQIEASALRIGKSTIFTAREVGSAMHYLGVAGMNAKQILGSIDATALLGAATDTKIGGQGGTADILTNIMTPFGLAANQSMRLADILARGTTRANIEMHDLGQSMKYVANAAKQVGVDVEEATAMVTVLGNAGIRGGMAGRGLANVLTYMSRIQSEWRTPKQAEMLKSIGMNPSDLRDSQGELRDMAGLLDVFRQKMRHLPGTERLAILSGVLNIRGARAFMPLFEEGTKLGLGFAEMLTLLRDGSQGAAEEIARMRLDNLKGDIIILKSAWEAFKIAQGSALEGTLRFITQGLTKVVNLMTRVAEHPIGKALMVLGSVFAIATLGLGAFLVLFSTFGLMITTSRTSLKSMRAALVWTWNSGTAAVARYIAAAQGASFVGPGGSFVQKGKKGFQSINKPNTLMGSSWIASKLGLGEKAKGATQAGTKGMKGFISSLTKSSGLLGKLGRVLKLVLGPIGWIIGLAVSFMGLKNIVNLLVWGLGKFLHSIMFIYDYIKGVFTQGDLSGRRARENWNKRSNKLNKATGLDLNAGVLGWGQPASPGVSKSQKEYEKKEMGRMIETLGKMAGKETKVSASNVNLDGKKVGEIIFENEEYSSLKDFLNNTSQ
jgi:TP901 family phage tail tape measure protein